MANETKPKKQIQLNFFETTCTGPVSGIGQWKDPEDMTRTKDSLEYWIWLAKIAEKGKISSVFFADSYGGHEIYQKSIAAQYKGGSHVAKMEPTTVISVMASVTKSVGFGITGSTSYLRERPTDVTHLDTTLISIYSPLPPCTHVV
jgi:alkanesulfonate monooxygenase SsuD/methylene tetrahydromethanopterin reductase-like flavin-dependent oxidoreductase (luciferase family)